VETSENKEETPKQAKAKKTTAKTKKEPLPAQPLQPIAPVAPTTPEIAPKPEKEAVKEQKTAPKKRGRKATEKQETSVSIVETTKKEQAETVKTEQEQPVKTEETPKKDEPIEQPKGTLMDMSFLLGASKKADKPSTAEKTEEKPLERAEEAAKETPKTAISAPEKTQEKPQPQEKQDKRLRVNKTTIKVVKPVKKPLTADEKLQAAFLSRLHRLGGDYFEYYSVYLLEKYSRQNGRRLEALRITSGDRDGGIDGEIELTDRLGFRETIYIQSKNWDPDKGDEKLWVVGETLLQQFIGACACRQAKDGKQHCRGIFITTSRFTPDAKRLLDVMSDKIVGYDGKDLYETAKECQFGIVKKNGEWVLDEQLLAGEKAFFHMQ
jgi:restriction endonuclease Mrr